MCFYRGFAAHCAIMKSGTGKCPDSIPDALYISDPDLDLLAIPNKAFGHIKEYYYECQAEGTLWLSLIHISEPTRL